MRLLFVADVHGSNTLLKKSVRSIYEYHADAMIIAGDLSGKQLVPIIREGPHYFRLLRGAITELIPASEVGEAEADLGAKGIYTFRTTEAEVELIRRNPLRLEAEFTSCIIDRLDRWAKFIAQEIDLSKISLLISPGNDDPFEVDQALERYESLGIRSHLDGILKFGANEVVTLDYTNHTPWGTPREMSENQLARLIEERLWNLEVPSLAIFNFHCPPYRTKLDLAPELDNNLRRVLSPGGDGTKHVGSRAVREAIEERSPLLTLHGHIHEAAGEDRIGSTICLNPGSEYSTGILHGYVIDLSSRGELQSYIRFEA